MLAKVLIIGFRNLLKNKTFSLINVIGLAVGLASCVFLILIANFHFHFDEYHTKLDRIYRLNDRIVGQGSVDHNTALTPPEWPYAMKEEFPEIENFVRFEDGSVNIRLGDEVNNYFVMFADSTLFDVFDFPLIAGDPETALDEPYSIILGKNYAEQFFPDEDPVGKTLFAVVDNRNYLVTGVMDEMPFNTTMYLPAIASYNTLNADNYQYYRSWYYHATTNFLLLKPNTDYKKLQAKFSGFIDEHMDTEKVGRYKPFLQPMKNYHLRKRFMRSERGNFIDQNIVLLIGGIGLLVIILASINYINLSSAISLRRSREVGMRKIFGSQRKQIIMQFIAESLILSIPSGIIGTILLELIINHLNTASFDNIFPTSYYSTGYIFATTMIISVIVGLLAGIYPSFVLSSYRPAAALKDGSTKGLKGMWFRKLFIVVQFFLAITLLVININFYRQVKYMETKDYGFSPDSLFMISNPIGSRYERAEVFRQRLLDIEGVKEVGFSANTPGLGYWWGRFLPEDAQQEDGRMYKVLFVDDRVMQMMDFKLLEGRFFSTEFATDSINTAIINEAALREFGWDTAVGKTVDYMYQEFGDSTRTIIGVVKDFHSDSLVEPITPMIIMFNPNFMNIANMKYDVSRRQEIKDEVVRIWKEYQPDQPINYGTFFEDILIRRIQGIKPFVRMISMFTGLSIFIACMGLFGLVSLVADQKRKEMGIRKVFGASGGRIAYEVSSYLLKFVIVANVIAIPFAWFVMKQVTNNMAYVVAFVAWPCIVAAVATLLIALFSVGWHAIKTARSNPVESLRYE